jgi:hypothetical protein
MFIILFSNCSFLTSFATTDSENITFKDEKLKKLIQSKYDTNGDGEYTKEELENVDYLNIDTTVSEEGYSDLKYFKNLKYLYVRTAYTYKELDISYLSNLTFFYMDNIVDIENLPQIKVPENLWIYVKQSTKYSLDDGYEYDEGKYEITSVDLKSFNEEDMYVKENKEIPISFSSVFDDNLVTISDESVISYKHTQEPNGKITTNEYYFTGKKAGSTNVTLKSSLCERTIKINVKNNSINPNIGLKNNTEDANLYYDTILTASGNLYRLNENNPKSSMQKIASNVSKYVYSSNNSAYLIGNNLTINYKNKIGDSVDGKDVTINDTTSVKDVKDFNSSYICSTGRDGISYLDSKNKLNFTYYDTANKKFVTTAIAENVTKLADNFYVKDNATYCIATNEKISDQPFSKAYNNYYVIGNNLYSYTIGSTNENGTYIYKCDTKLETGEFLDFVYDGFQDPIKIKLTDGNTKNLYDYDDDTIQIYSSSMSYDLNCYYELKNDNNLYYADILMLTNVKNIKYIMNLETEQYGLLVLRTDGSVYYQDNPYTGWTCVLENTKTATNTQPNNTQKTYTANQVANLIFDYKYYSDNNPDLKNVFGYNAAALKNHWLTFGIKEGRQASPVFNAKYYLENNSDLKKVFGEKNYTAAYNHFITYGYKELRASSVLYSGSYYKEHNSDLSKLNMDGYELIEHYLNFGQKEGRKANVPDPTPVSIVNSLFNSAYYAALNPDLKEVFGNNVTALRNHWLTFGIKEGRQASPVFDAKYYLENNSDLKKVFGEKNYTAAYNHFITYGINEGRKGSNFFDVKYYLTNNSDLQSAFGSNYSKVLNHFVSNGLNEGRDGSSTFKISVYKSTYSDLRNTFGNNNLNYYIHYITNGQKEGRKVN